MNQNTSQPYPSTSPSAANSSSTTISLRGLWNVSWRILTVAAAFMLTSLIAGRLLGRGVELGASGISLLSGLLIAVTLAPIAAGLRTSRLGGWIIWGSPLFLNALSLGIEGAFFVPSLSPMRGMPVAWTAFLLLQSLATAGLIAWLFGQNAGWAIPRPRPSRAWYSWLWRFLASAFSYLLFYFVFGAINYQLVTKPFYAAHVSGLAVPPPLTVLVAEMVRAPLIVLSVVPLILSWRGERSTLAIACGATLFVVGGVVPLLLNTDLPDILRLASAIEIFFQNFSTGLVAVSLLGFQEASAAQNR